MKSKVYVTEQIDDAAQGAAELARAVMADGASRGSSAGILMCYSDMDVDVFTAELTRRLPFDIIGCTCIASISGADAKEETAPSPAGFHVLTASLLVLTGEEGQFAAGASGAIVPGNVDACVREAYRAAVDRLGETPRLLYVIPPYNLDIMLDEFTLSLNSVARGIPVIGGLPSYNATGDVNATLFGGEAYPDRLVLLAIGGDIRPVFSIQNVLGSAVERKRKVTEARANTVYRVGSQSFVEYMRDVGFPLESLTGSNDTITYVSNPILLENVRMEGQDGFSFVRTLHKVDLEEGSGTAIGMIPVGATLSISTLDKDGIAKAAQIGMADLRAKMDLQAREGYAFSTVLAVSCIGRYLIMLPQSATEAESLLAGLPGGLTMAGFYGYGEIGPMPMGGAGSLNFALNESLVLCAF